ncbi:MAG: hypothetical protein COC01_05735 [Bacteroidetes bacterium]|nr:MAG: hypothetical protein COC01_05735 [Bacteroidota bacterium]
MKKIIIGLVAFIVLFVLGIFLIPIVYKSEIVAMVKEEINNNVEAKVDFSDFDATLINNFPDLTIAVKDLRVVCIGDFEGDTLASIELFEITVDVMSVITGDQIGVKTIKIDKPRINARILKNGKANWELTSDDGTAEEDAGSTEETKFKVALKNYEMNDAVIFYEDQTIPFSTKLIGFTHKMTGDFTQDIFDLKNNIVIDALDMTFDGMRYMKSVKTDFQANLEMDMVNYKYTFKDNKLQLNDLFLGFDGWVAMPTDDIDMDMKFFTKETSFKSLLSMIPSAFTADFADVKTGGTLALTGFVKGKYSETNTDTTMPGFNIDLKIADAMVKYPDLPSSIDNINIELKVENVDGEPDNTNINIPKFHIEIDGDPFDMRLALKTPVSDPDIDAEINGRLDLDKLTKAYPLEDEMKVGGIIDANLRTSGKMSAIDEERYEDFNTDGNIEFTNLTYEEPEMPSVLIKSMIITFNPKNVSLTKFDSKLGKSDFSANGTLDNYFGYLLRDEPLKGSLNLSSNLFDADEWLEEESEDGGSASSSQVAAEDTIPLEIIEIPKNIDFVMNVSMKKILYDNMTINDLQGAVRVKDQVAIMNNLKMNMLQGEVVVNGSYNTQDIEIPIFDFDLKVKACDIQESFYAFNTVQAIVPMGKYTSGRYSTEMSIKGKLDDEMMPDMNSLDGHGLMLVIDAVVENFKPLVKVSQALKMKMFEKYEIKNTKVSFTIADGRMILSPFDIKDGDNKFNISGNSGFDSTIDYLVKADVPRSIIGGQANALIDNFLALGGAQAQNLIGDRINVNINIGGTIDNPTIKTGFGDNASTAKSNLQDKAKDALAKKKKELEDKVKQEADKAKAKAKAEAEKAKQKAKQDALKKKKEIEAKLKAEAAKRKKAAKEKAKEEAEKAKQKAAEEAKKKLKGLLKNK